MGPSMFHRESLCPVTCGTLQRADQLAGLDPRQLLADARDLVDRVEPDRHLQAEALPTTASISPLPGARPRP
jgi:hypothetical protein